MEKSRLSYATKWLKKELNNPDRSTSLVITSANISSMPDCWEASDAKSKDADALDQNCFNYNCSAVLGYAGVDTEAFDWFPMGGSRPA